VAARRAREAVTWRTIAPLPPKLLTLVFRSLTVGHLHTGGLIWGTYLLTFNKSVSCLPFVLSLFQTFSVERRERNWNTEKISRNSGAGQKLVFHTPMARRDAKQGSRTGATGVSASFWPEVSPGREPTRKVHGRASRLKRVCAVPGVPCVLLIDPAHRDCARTRRRCVLHRKASRTRRLRAT
jgi:hypothetical protein